jgi:hypothetical protein
MRFDGMGGYDDLYNAQQQMPESKTFFNINETSFVAAVGAGDERQKKTEIIKRFAHMTFKDSDNILSPSSSGEMSSGVGIILEAFVRIRDKRVLRKPPDGIPEELRVGGSRIRLPLMGNLLHSYDGSCTGQGYQLACSYDDDNVGPVCCAEAYLKRQDNAETNKPTLSACVSIKEMMNLKEQVTGETSWFHISGLFAQRTSGPRVAVKVQQWSGYYSQSQYYSDYKFDIDTKVPGDPINFYEAMTCSEHKAAFRLASTLPFDQKGSSIGGIQNNQFLFLRCDIDEVKIWVIDDESELDWFEGVESESELDWFEGVSPTTDSKGSCAMRETSGYASWLKVYIKEQKEGNAINSSVSLPMADTLPIKPLDGATTTQDNLRDTEMLAANVDSSQQAASDNCKLEGNYRHFDACGQTYLDRRVEVVSSSQSSMSLDTTFQYEAYRDGRDTDRCPLRSLSLPSSLSSLVLQRREALTLTCSDRCSCTSCVGGRRVDMWKVDPASGVGKARIVFVDRNYNDRVQLTKKYWHKEYYFYLDYPLDNVQFQEGLPFYNLASGTQTLANFEQYERGIHNHSLNSYSWIEPFVPKQQDSNLCVWDQAGKNCEGLEVNFNLTLPSPWVRPNGGSHAWDIVCNDAFEKHRIAPKYRFLCTEWWVPYGRGWAFKVPFKEFPCPESDYRTETLETVYRARVGYEARPEWYSFSEYPKRSASGAGSVNAGSSASCPDPDEVKWTRVEDSVLAPFRARDRNKVALRLAALR